VSRSRRTIRCPDDAARFIQWFWFVPDNERTTEDRTIYDRLKAGKRITLVWLEASRVVRWVSFVPDVVKGPVDDEWAGVLRDFILDAMKNGRDAE
jgi:hypothetical protein